MLSMNLHMNNERQFSSKTAMILFAKKFIYRNLQNERQVFINKYDNTLVVTVKKGMTVINYSFYPIALSAIQVLHFGERAVLVEKSELERQGY